MCVLIDLWGVMLYLAGSLVRFVFSLIGHHPRSLSCSSLHRLRKSPAGISWWGYPWQWSPQWQSSSSSWGIAGAPHSGGTWAGGTWAGGCTREYGAGGRAPPKSAVEPKQQTKKIQPRIPNALADRAKLWSDRFPHGHFLAVSWPVTIKQYPARELDHSWRTIEDLAECYHCVAHLRGMSGQRAGKPRPPLLTVKGVHVTECFFAVVRASRLSFKGNSAVKFNSETVAPISNNILRVVLISY